MMSTSNRLEGAGKAGTSGHGKTFHPRKKSSNPTNLIKPYRRPQQVKLDGLTQRGSAALMGVRVPTSSGKRVIGSAYRKRLAQTKDPDALIDEQCRELGLPTKSSDLQICFRPLERSSSLDAVGTFLNHGAYRPNARDSLPVYALSLAKERRWRTSEMFRKAAEQMESRSSQGPEDEGTTIDDFSNLSDSQLQSYIERLKHGPESCPSSSPADGTAQTISSSSSSTRDSDAPETRVRLGTGIDRF